MRTVVTTLAVLALFVIAPAAAHAQTAAAVDGAYAAQAALHPGLVTRVEYGESRGGRDLVAYRVGSTGPAVLYAAAQDGDHELAVGVQQRLFDDVVANPVAGVQMWFVPIVDPDGYDGPPSNVAFDRNWPDHWGFDNEGSSAANRGPHAASEPEVAALGDLLADVRPTRLLDWQEGEEGRILYPESWQVQTPATDAPAFEALAGRDDAHSAILGYSPGPAGELATANGTLIDTAYRKYGTLAFAVHIPDNGVELAEYAKTRDFALDLAQDEDGPDFVPHEFTVSYGQPQTVEVNARRALGAVSAHWRVAGGPEQSEPLGEYKGGERYGAPGAVYHRLRGQVTGFRAGDSVQVWFEGGGESSAPFTFTAAVSAPKDVLVLAAEDYSGTHPGPVHPGPEYLSFYTDALQSLGVSYDVYDIDARGRTAPDPLGVLSHYDAVVWYTGDDVYVREPGQPANTGTSRVFGETILAARDYLNDGGKVLVSGQQALLGAWAQLVFDPFSDGDCGGNNLVDMTEPRCVPAADDFMQYWLGATMSGIGSSAEPMRAGSTAFSLDGVSAAQRFLSTSAVLPQFASERVAGYDRPAAFGARSGTHFAFAASAFDRETDQRLTRTIDLTGATTAALRLAVSYDTEEFCDFVSVKVREHGTVGWTELHPADGDSEGYEEWDVDLTPWAGMQVDIAIAYVQDPGWGGVGVAVDDVRVVQDGTVVDTEDFENGLGDWQADGFALHDTGVAEGLGIATSRSILWGFGLENVVGADTRKRLLGDALARLLGAEEEPPTEEPPPTPPPVPPTPPVAPQPPKVAPPELVIGSSIKVDSRGRAKIKVRCATACSGVVKLTRGKRTFARATYRRSGTVTLRLDKAGRRATVLRLRLYRGSGRGARLIDTSTVRLRRA